MEDTRHITDQVHVLRHGFEPNEPFQAALSRLTRDEARTTRPFSIYGSDERVVETVDIRTIEFEEQKLQAYEKLAKQQDAHIYLKNELTARILINNKAKAAIALRLVMNPILTKEFQEITNSLDVIKFGSRNYAKDFEQTRLYMDIPSDQLRSTKEVRQQLETLNDNLRSESTHRLYYLTPVPHLVGHFKQAVRRDPSVSLYQQHEAS